MKRNEQFKKFQQMSPEQLGEHLNELRRELFSLKLKKVTAHVKDYSAFAKLRKDIARAMTLMNLKKAQ